MPAADALDECNDDNDMRGVVALLAKAKAISAVIVLLADQRR